MIYVCATFKIKKIIMKNFRSIITIVLAVFGLAALNSCAKTITCECELEGSPNATVTIDIQGKSGDDCDDLDGEMDIYGGTYDVENCEEE